MGTRVLVAFLCVVVVIAGLGCRKDSAAQSPGREGAAAAAAAAAAEDAQRRAGRDQVTVRIRKLGGADGKQLMNEMAVATPVGDDFAVTEQVGTKQLEFRGKVLDLQDGRYRVRYDYTETSADGQQKLNSLVEMRANDEKPVGGMQGAAGMETVVLSLSRP